MWHFEHGKTAPSMGATEVMANGMVQCMLVPQLWHFPAANAMNLRKGLPCVWSARLPH